MFIDFKYIFIKFLQTIILIYNLYCKLVKNYNIKLSGKENILITRLDRIGDAVWGVELAKIIKKNYPHIKIDILCNNYNYFVFEENKQIFNKIIKLDCSSPSYTIKNIFKPKIILKDFIECKNKLNKNFYKYKYDIIIDTTSKKFFFLRKNFGKIIITPIGHKEIGNTKYLHGIPYILNLKPYPIYNTSKRRNNYKGLLFLGGKEPNKLDEITYKKIIKEFSQLNIKILTISDNINTKANYYLRLKDTFYVGNEPLKNFLKNFDFFFSVDGGVFHYASQYINGIGFYTITNLLSIDKVKKIYQLGERKIFKSEIKNNLYITKLLPCVGCFQIGCQKRPCKNILDNELKIIIKKIVDILYK